MRLEVCFTPTELPTAGVAGRAVVVIDVLRATSSILEALCNGARAVCPAATPEEATVLAQRVGRRDTLLCGERRGVRIDGFDLGNSPLEFTREKVTGKLLAMTTTNGTAALLAAGGSATVLLGSLLNLGAVADCLASNGEPAIAVCAGREGNFALEDAACAGLLVLALRDRMKRVTLNDAGVAAAALARPFREKSLLPLLKRSAGGRALLGLGLGDDVAFCARVDRYDMVPELRDRQVTAPRVART